MEARSWQRGYVLWLEGRSKMTNILQSFGRALATYFVFKDRQAACSLAKDPCQFTVKPVKNLLTVNMPEARFSKTVLQRSGWSTVASN